MRLGCHAGDTEGALQNLRKAANIVELHHGTESTAHKHQLDKLKDLLQRQ